MLVIVKLGIFSFKTFGKLPDAIGHRAFRCIFFPEKEAAAIAALAMPAARSAIAGQAAGRSASASPSVSHRQPKIGTYRCALPADLRAHRQAGPCFPPFITVAFYLPIEQAFQPFQFFNRKGKAPCAVVKGV
jgi:hypothetical protein